MSGTEEIRQFLESTLQTQLAVALPTTPVRFINTNFVTPVRTPWIHIAVLPNKLVRAAISAKNEFKALGVINATCMTPELEGTVDLRVMADAVSNIMVDRSWPLPGGGSVTTYEVTQRDGGCTNGWYSCNVFISYRARIALPGR